MSYLPSDFSQLSSLTSLFLVGNFFPVIPEVLSELKNLIMLDIRDNAIKDLHSITNLSSMQEDV